MEFARNTFIDQTLLEIDVPRPKEPSWKLSLLQSEEDSTYTMHDTRKQEHNLFKNFRHL